MSLLAHIIGTEGNLQGGIVFGLVPTDVESYVQPSSSSSSSTYVITPSASSFDENDLMVCTVTTTNVADGTTLYWKLNTVSGTINTSDISSLSGSITINNNTATISRVIFADATTEGVETFTISLHTNSITGTQVAETSTLTINDTSVPPSQYTIAADKTTITEGETVVFTINANVSDGTSVYWYTQSVTGVVSADFSTASTGTAIINNNTATVSLTAANDLLTEGDNIFKLRIKTDSAATTILAESAMVTITDTSVSPAYAVTLDKTTVTENNEVINFTITNTNYNAPDGTQLYWYVYSTVGAVTSADFSTPINGTVTLSNGVASGSITTAADLATEGSNEFQIHVRLTDVYGSTVAQSQSITIQDTSVAQTATYSVSSQKGSMSEGDTNIITITTTNVNNGTQLYWDVVGVSSTINSSDFTALQGTITINNNSGSVTLSTLNDLTTEGTETFKVNLRTVSNSGTIVASTSNITISDTSVTPPQSLLLVNNGTTDRSSKSLSPTTSGTVALDYSDVKFSYPSIKFTTGALQYTHSSFAVGTGAFTVDYWVKRTGNFVTSGICAGGVLSGSTGIQCYTASTTSFTAMLGNQSGTIIGTVTLPLNTWTHIAITRFGTTARLFVNGTLQNSITNSTHNISSQYMSLGSRYTNPSGSLATNLLISNFRYLNTCAWVSNFSVPTTDY